MLVGSKETHKFKEMKDNYLVSLPVLPDNGFKIILDQHKIYITKLDKVHRGL